MSDVSALDRIEAELERLASSEIEASRQLREKLRQLIESANEVVELMQVDTSFTTVSTSVMILDRNLSEALREATKYDAWCLARRNLAVVKRHLKKAGDSP